MIDITPKTDDSKPYRQYIEYNGMTKSITEWAEYLGITRYALEHRLRNNWSLERAFTQKKGKYRERMDN
jgi:hypothetical protein